MISALTNRTAGDDLVDQISTYTEHLLHITDVFNKHAESLGLGVRLDATQEISAVKRGSGLPRVLRFINRTDDSGVLHEPQLMTALNCIGEMLTSPDRNGIVLGAMQSGKTTTSLALQLAGPTIYLLTGRHVYPIYLITSHTSQEDQTKIELQRFLDFYGELRVYKDEEHQCRLIDYVRDFRVDAAFSLSPTINMYREHVLRNALKDTFVGPKLDDLVQRRAAGEGIDRVAQLCRRANQQGFEPLLIIDEPQYGASDRFVEKDGQIERRACVLLRIFQQIEDALGPEAPDHQFIGLSATPYELNGIEAVWKVKQYLSSSYKGFNYFGGEVIDSETTVSPPTTISFQDYGRAHSIPFLENVSLAAYDAQPNVFKRFAKKIGFAGTQAQYRALVENSLRETVLYMAKNGTRPDVGICVRLFNSNAKSHQLIEKLKLDANEIETIEYFGGDHRGASVKRAIRNRERHELPFLIAVTNRARMGDAFPQSVEWFLEFSKKASDLNALLQGLLGRACGYGKRSTVVMSDENVRLVRDYERTQGGYIYKTSRHSKVVGNYRRGAPTSLIRLRAGTDDPLLKRYFERLQNEVVDVNIKQNSASLSPKRATGGKNFRTGPILRIAEELGLFEHLEEPEVRAKLFPTYPEFRIARSHDQVQHARDVTKKLGYTLDGDGNCRFTFRWTKDGEHGGVRSRGYGARDAADRLQAGDTLEPQVNMQKFSASNGDLIDDKDKPKAERKAGLWQATVVTLPLVSAVRELQAGSTTFPIETSPYSELMSEEERSVAGFTKTRRTNKP